MVLAVVSSCKQESDIPDADSYNTVYMAQAKSVQDFVFSQVKGSDNVFVGASYGGLDYAPEDIRVEFDVDFSLVEEYNELYGTEHLPLPVSNISFSEKITTIKKGELQSTPLPINIDFAALPTFTSYLLPVKVASVSGDAPLKEELSTAYFRIEVRSEPVPVKVMMLGKGGTNNDMDKLAQIIQDTSPDIVLIREMDKNTNRSGSTNDWPAILSQKLGSEFNSLFVPSILEYQGGQYGMGVYSRYPISHIETHLLYHDGTDPNTRENGPFATMDVDVDGKTLKLAVVHTSANATIRPVQLQEMTEILGDDDGQPLVLLGNMNVNPNGGDTYLALSTIGVIPACTSCPPNFSATNPTSWSDMTLFRPSGRFNVVSHTVGTAAQTVGGTHLPVFTTLNVYF